MSKIIPLISSGCAGPLGVLHLPRLWQKASLAAVGKDHPDYPALSPGYDHMVLIGLGIDIEAFRKFIADEKPTTRGARRGFSHNAAVRSIPKQSPISTPRSPAITTRMRFAKQSSMPMVFPTTERSLMRSTSTISTTGWASTRKSSSADAPAGRWFHASRR